ncbi:unnamed protein product [Thelazia callipaeda]|uniref:OAR domain-containing protein n=1 Tax=Thelazia callipaeda TaxID=103827 RepID=A0A0N5D0G3_THECL|nr:unnamed protein product [Thelazia callipaeda]
MRAWAYGVRGCTSQLQAQLLALQNLTAMSQAPSPTATLSPATATLSQGTTTLPQSFAAAAAAAAAAAGNIINPCGNGGGGGGGVNAVLQNHRKRALEEEQAAAAAAAAAAVVASNGRASASQQFDQNPFLLAAAAAAAAVPIFSAGTVPCKRPAAEKSGVPVYANGATAQLAAAAQIPQATFNPYLIPGIGYMPAVSY